MPSAIVLIDSEPGSEEKVLAFVEKEIPVIDFATRVYGLYNVIVKVKTETEDELKKTIHGIRTLEFVRSTATLLIRES